MADKKPKPKKKAKVKPIPAKSGAGAPIGNKNREIYTLEIALDLFERAKDILVSDTTIITETILMVKCKYKLSLPMSSYLYLRDEKFPIVLKDIKREIDSILEDRVIKSKDIIAAGIAAMTLKNKHQWKDQQDINQNIKLPPGLKISFDAET